MNEVKNLLKDPEKRRKFYAYSLLGCVIAIAAIGLLNIWGIGPQDSTFYKIMLTLVIVATLSGFLYTLNFGSDQKYSQKLVYLIGGAASLLSLLVIIQMWTTFMDGAIFGKTTLSLVVIGLLAAFVLALFDDFFENKKLKDDNYLD